MTLFIFLSLLARVVFFNCESIEFKEGLHEITKRVYMTSFKIMVELGERFDMVPSSRKPMLIQLQVGLSVAE